MSSTKAEWQKRPLEHVVGPEHVFPVPKSARAQAKYTPGPTMTGDVKPTRDGRYLRYFDDVDDWAWSEFSEGKWLCDGFWPSDVQDAPWRGALKPNAALSRDSAEGDGVGLKSLLEP